MRRLKTCPMKAWPTTKMVAGVWTIFPHISIASFAGGGRSVMISQLFPGDTPETSYTNQIFLMQQAPDTEALKRDAAQQFKFLEYVVQEEDYATGIALQKNLNIGARDHVLFGKNEGGRSTIPSMGRHAVGNARRGLAEIVSDGLVNRRLGLQHRSMV